MPKAQILKNLESFVGTEDNPEFAGKLKHLSTEDLASQLAAQLLGRGARPRPSMYGSL